VLALLVAGTPLFAPESLRIERMSVLEQRSGWIAAGRPGLFEAGDCEASFARIVLASSGAAVLEHRHALLRSAQPLSGFERVGGNAWRLTESGIAELHYRELSALPGREVQLFDGKSLEGWHLIGEATFGAEENSILGQTSTGKTNSFLVTNETYGDFLLTLEVKNEQPGNSGIQIRSRVVGEEPKSSYASGYQIEIDPSARSWSGGLYEERGRGWLQNLEQNEAGKAFRSGEWNRYRIECVGPWIRAWVNDVPTADAFDPEALGGIIALQVHAGQDTKVRFRGFKLHVFGQHAWKPLDAKLFATEGARLGSDFGLRFTRASGGSLAGCQLRFRGDFRSPGPSSDPRDDMLRTDNMRWLIALDDPRLAKRDWKELVLLAYADRTALFCDHELVLDSRAFCGADGPLVWIQRPEGASEALLFERVESLEPATR